MPWGSIIGAAIGAGANLLSSRSDRRSQESMADQNAALQREFAQKGVRWKVEDAKKAGIHPLFAVGAQTHSFQPSFVGGSSSPDFTSFGQDIGRAIDKTRTQPERFDARMRALQLERGELENEFLRSRIARLQADQVGPPMPSNSAGLFVPGQGDASQFIVERPMERTPSAPGALHQEPGAVPELGFARTPSGLAPVPSQDAKDRMEDMIVPELMWSWRNNVLPNFGAGEPPPKSWLPRGALRWKWNRFNQEWQPDFGYEGKLPFLYRDGRRAVDIIIPR